MTSRNQIGLRYNLPFACRRKIDFTDEKLVANKHCNDIVTNFAVSITESQEMLPTFYWLSKLHKRPSKDRFIANSSICTTTSLSKVLTSCLTAIKIIG